MSQSRAADYCAGALQTSNNGQLQQDGRWDASHYGNLEQFIYDYLTGGTSAGETVRLKLQTPLFVAEALAQAAHFQLTDELETATQVQLNLLMVVDCLVVHLCLLLSTVGSCWCADEHQVPCMLTLLSPCLVLFYGYQACTRAWYLCAIKHVVNRCPMCTELHPGQSCSKACNLQAGMVLPFRKPMQ